MSIAAIIWLAITVVLAVFTFLGGILDVRWAFDVGASLTLVSFLGFGISLLIEYNRRYRRRVMAIQKQAQEEAAQKRAAEEATARQNAQEEAEKRTNWQAEWNKYFETFDFKVAGVTFDGHQSLLREIYRNHEDFAEDPTVTLEPFQYEGNPAYHVLADGKCIGNIPAEDIEFCSSILSRVSSIDLTVDRFVPEGKEVPKEEDEDEWDEEPGNWVYYAKIHVNCKRRTR